MNKITMVGNGKHSIVPMVAFDSATFTFGLLTAIQFVDSATYLKDRTDLIRYKDFGLLAKLSSLVMITNISNFKTVAAENESEPITISLTGTELKTIQKWIEAKHDHCDKGQDAPEFNQATFYMLKELVLSIRELLLPRCLTREEKSNYTS